MEPALQHLLLLGSERGGQDAGRLQRFDRMAVGGDDLGRRNIRDHAGGALCLGQ
jgi:hypothetical protein